MFQIDRTVTQNETINVKRKRIAGGIKEGFAVLRRDKRPKPQKQLGVKETAPAQTAGESL